MPAICPKCHSSTEIPTGAIGMSFPCAQCGQPVPLPATAPSLTKVGNVTALPAFCPACNAPVEKGDIRCMKCDHLLQDFSLTPPGGETNFAKRPVTGRRSSTIDLGPALPELASAEPAPPAPPSTGTAAFFAADMAATAEEPPPPPEFVAEMPPAALGEMPSVPIETFSAADEMPPPLPEFVADMPPLAPIMPSTSLEPPMVAPRLVTVAAEPIMIPRPMTVTVPPLPPPDAMPVRATGIGATSAPRLTTAVAPPPPLPATSSRQQTLALAAVMVLMLAGIGVGIWFWLNPAPAPPPGPEQPGAGADNKKTTTSPQKPAENLRVYKAPKDMVDAIAIDLSNIPRKEQEQKRYFTLVHLHNNPAVSKENLAGYRQALQDLVNHLTDQPNALVAVDKDQLIFRVDLKSVKWEDKSWRVVSVLYPYGLNLESMLYLSEPYNYIMKGTRAPITWIYADWFIATASDTDGKLYESLHVSDKADPLPDTVQKLAKSYLDQPVTLELATAELGMDVQDSSRVKSLLATKANLGLEELTKGKTVTREEWTARKELSLSSVYQTVAFELERGTPIQIK